MLPFSTTYLGSRNPSVPYGFPSVSYLNFVPSGALSHTLINFIPEGKVSVIVILLGHSHVPFAEL